MRRSRDWADETGPGGVDVGRPPVLRGADHTAVTAARPFAIPFALWQLVLPKLIATSYTTLYLQLIRSQPIP
jgi:hypothetical protein